MLPDRPVAWLGAAVAALLLLLALPAACPALADDAGARREAIEQELGAARAREAEIGRVAETVAQDLARLQTEIAAVAARAESREAKLAELEEALDTLFAAEAAKAAGLAARRGQLAGLLGALERIARQPPVALIALPQSPNDTVRSALLMRDLMPRLAAEARALDQDVARLAALREEIAAERARHADSGRALEDERSALAALLRERAAHDETLGLEGQQVRQRIARLAAEAKDMQGLMDRLAAPPPVPRPNAAAEPQPGAAMEAAPAARLRAGLLHTPVVGRIVAAFGDSNEYGLAARGVTVEARPGAPVVAPRDGEVVFAGPFRGYGLLLILELGDGYHVLVSGLSRIDAALGTHVRKGEPVGTVDEADGKPALYVELRRQGRPIDPVPWLAATTSKVSG